MSSRIGALFAPNRAIYSCAVMDWDSETFTLNVSDVIGTLSEDLIGLAVWPSGRRDNPIRIRDVDTSASTITLCETGHDFSAGDVALVYSARLPWPRYQHIHENGGGELTVYKDYDIAWPSASGSQPPICIVTHRFTPGSGDYVNTGAVWVPVDNSIQFNLSGSYGVYQGATITSYTWEPGDNGTVSAGDGTVEATISWSTEGFRYLYIQITDSEGTTANRYIPIWVGDECWEIINPSLSWSNDTGWIADFELAHTVLPLVPNLVAIVDLDSWDILLFGFAREFNSSYTPGTANHRVRCESALAYSKGIYAFPFTLYDEKIPTGWSNILALTIARAMAFLLTWHTNITEIVNIDLGDVSERRINGYPFPAGSITSQIISVLGATRWLARGRRDGGFSLGEDPLYQDTSDWLGYTGLDLSDTEYIETTSNVGWSVSKAIQVRLSGIYLDPTGSWEPVIVVAPAHPGALGSPEELSNMAPLNVDEAKLWAKRHYAYLNQSDEYGVTTLNFVDPVSNWVADLPNGERINIERVSMRFNKRYAWQYQVTGRSYGAAPTVIEEDPPVIIYPDPVTPSPTPPVTPPVDPDPEWPTDVYILTREHGAFKTTDFSGPDGEQCNWSDISTGLPTPLSSNIVYQAVSRKIGDTLYLYALVGAARDVYVSTGDSWSLLYAATSAATLTGLSGGIFLWMAIDPYNTSNFALGYGKETATDICYVLTSSDAGVSWTSNPVQPSLIANQNIFRRGGAIAYNSGIIYFGATMSTITNARVLYSTGGSSWQWSNSIGGLSSWRPPLYLKPGTSDIFTAEYDSGDWYVQVFSSLSVLERVESLPEGSIGQVTDGYPVLAFNVNQPDRAVVIAGTTLHYTTDGWRTANAVTMPAGFQGVWNAVARRYQWLILTKQSGGSATYTVYVSDDLGASITARSGPDPVTPDENSIPMVAELAYNGLVIDD